MQIYHPDKQAGNEFAQLHFIELKEAYDILKDDKKRAAYDYELWLLSKEKYKRHTAVTPEIIIASAKALNSHLSYVDGNSLVYSLLKEHILILLSDKNIGLLVQAQNNVALTRLTREAIKASGYLPLKYTVEITERMKSYTTHDEILRKEIEVFERKKRNQYRMSMIAPWLVFLSAVTLCVFIYFLR